MCSSFSSAARISAASRYTWRIEQPARLHGVARMAKPLPHRHLRHAVTNRKDCGCHKSDFSDPKCERRWPDLCPWCAYQLQDFSDQAPDAREYDRSQPTHGDANLALPNITKMFLLVVS